MKKVILISGKSNHGKTEFTKLLKEELESTGKKVVVMLFAKYIKMYLKDYYNWDGIEKTEDIRSHLQRLGTNKIRQEMNMKNFHVERVCDDIRILEDDFDYFIIDDTRYSNEIYYTKAIFDKDVIDIRITRPNFESPLTTEQQNHDSEIGLDDFDFMYDIINNKIEDLEEAVSLFAWNVLYR